jgi:hypothetical protein
VVELAFAQLKAFIRAARPRTFDYVCDLITVALGLFAPTEYRISSGTAGIESLRRYEERSNHYLQGRNIAVMSLEETTSIPRSRREDGRRGKGSRPGRVRLLQVASEAGAAYQARYARKGNRRV